MIKSVFFIVHKRLILAIIVGASVGLLTPPHWHSVTRALVGWNSGIWLYLAAIWSWMLHASTNKIRTLAQQENESSRAILALMSLASMMSVIAIVYELIGGQPGSSGLNQIERIVLTMGTIISTWFLIPTMYAVHYAHSYYSTGAQQAPPLSFPEHPAAPQYWDFFYFAVTIAVAAQTSDISICCTSLRKDVLAQSLLAFFFNVAIVGLTINIMASVVRP